MGAGEVLTDLLESSKVFGPMGRMYVDDKKLFVFQVWFLSLRSSAK